MNIQDPLKKKVSKNPRSSRPTLREPPLQRKRYTFSGAYHGGVLIPECPRQPARCGPHRVEELQLWLSNVNPKNSLHCQPGCALEPPGEFENIPVPMSTPGVVTELVWGVAWHWDFLSSPGKSVESENLFSTLASPFL